VSRLSKFEGKLDEAFENAVGNMFNSPISPVQMTKRAEKEMHREKLVSAGIQHAPTLYNVLVNPSDDEKLSGYYPTLAGEMETYLQGKADESGLHMDGHPLVRFIVDDKLKSGKFDVIAENVSSSIIQQLREEEMERYGIHDYNPRMRERTQQPASRQAAPAPAPRAPEAYPPADDYDNEPPYDIYDDYQDGYAQDAADDDAYFAAQDDFETELPPAPLPAQDYAPPTPAPAPAPAPQPVYRRPERAALYNMATGETFYLDGVQIRIGRDRSNDIVIHDRNVSRTHAEIVLEDGYWILNDLGSTNGTFLNDHEVTQIELRDGDMLTFGMTNFEFRRV